MADDESNKGTEERELIPLTLLAPGERVSHHATVRVNVEGRVDAACASAVDEFLKRAAAYVEQDEHGRAILKTRGQDFVLMSVQEQAGVHATLGGRTVVRMIYAGSFDDCVTMLAAVHRTAASAQPMLAADEHAAVMPMYVRQVLQDAGKPTVFNELHFEPDATAGHFLARFVQDRIDTRAKLREMQKLAARRQKRVIPAETDLPPRVREARLESLMQERSRLRLLDFFRFAAPATPEELAFQQST